MTRGTCYAALLLCTCTKVWAQQAQLDCQGVMGNTPAVMSGVRRYAPYNAVGDGYVRFAGTVNAGGIAGRVSYEGYTQTAPVIETAQGPLRIAVLDNTSGRMIIYGGTPSLGPPQTIGEFVCRWR
jgi:hypothetical protein